MFSSKWLFLGYFNIMDKIAYICFWCFFDSDLKTKGLYQKVAMLSWFVSKHLERPKKKKETAATCQQRGPGKSARWAWNGFSTGTHGTLLSNVCAAFDLELKNKTTGVWKNQQKKTLIFGDGVGGDPSPSVINQEYFNKPINPEKTQHLQIHFNHQPYHWYLNKRRESMSLPVLQLPRPQSISKAPTTGCASWFTKDLPSERLFWCITKLSSGQLGRLSSFLGRVEFYLLQFLAESLCVDCWPHFGQSTLSRTKRIRLSPSTVARRIFPTIAGCCHGSLIFPEWNLWLSPSAECDVLKLHITDSALGASLAVVSTVLARKSFPAQLFNLATLMFWPMVFPANSKTLGLRIRSSWTSLANLRSCFFVSWEQSHPSNVSKKTINYLERSPAELWNSSS